MVSQTHCMYNYTRNCLFQSDIIQMAQCMRFFSEHSSKSVHLESAEGLPKPLAIQSHLKLPISL